MAKLSTEVLDSLVSRVQAGDPHAVEELYSTVQKVFRYWLVKSIGAESCEDILHDAFIIVLEAVLAGDLRSKAAVLGFANTVVYRQSLIEVTRLIQARKMVHLDDLEDGEHPLIAGREIENPNEAWAHSEKRAIMREELANLKPLEQEILLRFYVNGEKMPAIQKAMNYTDTQFQLNKCRAKQKLERAVWMRLQCARLRHVKAIAQAA